MPVRDRPLQARGGGPGDGKRNPDSFQDPSELLAPVFEGKYRDEILAALRLVVLESPSILAALGIGEAGREYYVEEEDEGE